MQSREGSQKKLPQDVQDDYVKNNPKVNDVRTRIPLSTRELLIQTGDHLKKSDQRIYWKPGIASIGLVDAKDHPSIKAAEEAGELMLTGISGSTDIVLTLGHMLGMFDGAKKEESMRDGLVACIGWLGDAMDHTAHEVLVSGKTFGLEYIAGPESYRYIRPGNHLFLEKLQKAQRERGYKMPDEYLSAEFVNGLAQKELTKDAHQATEIMARFKSAVIRSGRDSNKVSPTETSISPRIPN